MHFILTLIATLIFMGILASIWRWMKRKAYKIGEKKVEVWLDNHEQTINSFKDIYEQNKSSEDLLKLISNLFYYEAPFTRMVTGTDNEKAIRLEPDSEFIKVCDNLNNILTKNNESVTFIKSIFKDIVKSEFLDNLNDSIILYGKALEHYTELRRYTLDDLNLKMRKQENKNFSKWTGLEFQRSIYEEIINDLGKRIDQINENLSVLYYSIKL
jgi:hypothetical protein